MKRCLIILALAASVSAQNAAPPAAPATAPKDVVATINGEVITAQQLDRLWNRMGAKMRAQYEKGGNGKLRFLDNYVGKRLLLQLAAQSDFEKSPGVQAELEAAREAALFDLYVRDVVASQIVNEDAIRKFYDEHTAEFIHPEAAKVRLILLGKGKHTDDDARRKAGDLMKELYGIRVGSGNDAKKITEAFAEAARKNSDHASAPSGGDLGWVGRDGLEPKISEAVFSMKPNTISGILETDAGTQLVLVEDRQMATTEPYEDARAGIREYLLGTNTQKVVEAVNRATRELRASSKVML
ncbi:MAG TPA: peptidylprolyl isomerase, partial [Thermoanaerobaculia bacterium]